MISHEIKGITECILDPNTFTDRVHASLSMQRGTRIAIDNLGATTPFTGLLQLVEVLCQPSPDILWQYEWIFQNKDFNLYSSYSER